MVDFGFSKFKIKILERGPFDLHLGSKGKSIQGRRHNRYIRLARQFMSLIQIHFYQFCLVSNRILLKNQKQNEKPFAFVLPKLVSKPCKEKQNENLKPFSKFTQK